MQVPYGMGDSTFAERMPSFTSLVCGPPPKRQRCLKFDSIPDEDNSSQEYSTQSPSPSCSQQESHSNAGLCSHSQLRTSSTSQSEQVDGPNDTDSIKKMSVKQDHGQQSASVRSSSRHASAALPALAAAMGCQPPNAASSAASAAAAAAAAVTPVTSRHMSSQSGML